VMWAAPFTGSSILPFNLAFMGLLTTEASRLELRPSRTVQSLLST
jgi:hypothetical protein